jgi:hypothetical protein
MTQHFLLNESIMVGIRSNAVCLFFLFVLLLDVGCWLLVVGCWLLVVVVVVVVSKA